jgi:N-methylhydantoinase A
MYVDATTGWSEVPVYEGAMLGPGHVLMGPLVVNEATTTVFAGSGDRLEVDTAGNYKITLGA